MSKKGFLILEDGTVYEGKGFGAEIDVNAEFVLNTGMTGYERMLSDPANAGLGIVATFPSVGNWGAVFGGKENKGRGASALVCREVSFCPPNNVGAHDLSDFMLARGITGLYGVDTRRLTKQLRAKGSMRGTVTFNANACHIIKKSTAEGFPSMEGCPASRLAECQGRGGLQITNIDNKVIIGEGPGDPMDYTEHLPYIKELMESGAPVFGIGLGHQLMALAMGFKTYKLPQGHRGANYPVKETATGKMYITAQNHGYAVDANSVDTNIAGIAYVNLHDGSVEGLEYKNGKCASLQFFPETGPYVLRPNAMYMKFLERKV